MKHFTSLIIVIAALGLASCTANKTPSSWLSYKNSILDISLRYPPEFMPDPVRQGSVTDQTGSYLVYETHFSQSDPMQAFFIVTRSSDPRLVADTAHDHPLVKHQLHGQEYWSFYWDGLGDPEGYLFNDGAGWIRINFIGITPDVMKGILTSIRVGPDAWSQ